MEINFGKTTEYTQSVSATDGEKTISASVRVKDGKMSSIESGTVYKGDIFVAQFSSWGNLSVNFHTTDKTSITDALTSILSFSEQCEIQTLALNSEEKAVVDSEASTDASAESETEGTKVVAE